MKLKSLIQWAVIGVGAYYVGSCINSCANDPASPSRGKTRASADIQMPLDGAVNRRAREFLDKYLNDPSSYQAVDNGVMTHPNGWLYVHTFRSKNGFGGLVKQQCGLVYTTNTTPCVWHFIAPEKLEATVKMIETARAATPSGG